MSNSEPTFGSEFRRIRREEGKTLEDVGDIWGVSIPHVSDMERGRRSPPPRAMIAKILSAWDRLRELDLLADLALQHRGEFQRAPKNVNERKVLVALDRALDDDLTKAQCDRIVKLLEELGRKRNE